MLIYNMTIKIGWTIQQNWLVWMREVYIPRIMQSGFFTKYQLVRLLEIDEDEGPTYALQLYALNIENYHRFVEENLPEIERTNYDKWGSDVFFFSTLMEIIE